MKTIDQQKQPSQKPVQAIVTQIKEGLHLAAQLILASPIKLPLRLVKGAKYVALAIGLFDQILHHQGEDDPAADANNARHETDAT
ncbi:hypothetical protein GCM10023231_18520 [Olivibacter ginsenosidimutans]|uniref:Uncharacterized protein n=1 Tax=Olivibacter ginsenosidimutans TaxID=1176537 RepID=A0ABP9B905_9SPHI